MKKLTYALPPSSHFYEIELYRNLLSLPKDLANFLVPLASSFALIVDDQVASLYGELLCKSLANYGLKVSLFSFLHGEENKTRATKESLENAMLEKGFGRDSCIIALGGGTTSDLAGYIAATYCRGLPLILIPTTLLGMVDATLGGKNGVNTSYGKNLIGTIFPPTKVLIDPSFLQSLLKSELKNGFAEMIKHGIIGDISYFEFLENHREQLSSLDPESIEKAIFESLRIKKEIVEVDEKERGRRRLLNFGHTIGHALEKLSDHALSHGEAVALGLVIESRLSLLLGHLCQKSYQRIQKIVKDYGLCSIFPCSLPIEKIFEAMILDKKSKEGKPRFVLIQEIGSPLTYGEEFCTVVDESLIQQALKISG